jgi:hypothetical protein
MAQNIDRAISLGSGEVGAPGLSLRSAISRMISEWERSDELAGEFADRLIAFLRARGYNLPEGKSKIE